MIAGCDFRNRLAYSLDNACTLMAKHYGLWHGKCLITHADVRVADASCHQPHENFAVSWLLKRKVSMDISECFARVTAA